MKTRTSLCTFSLILLMSGACGDDTQTPTTATTTGDTTGSEPGTSETGAAPTTSGSTVSDETTGDATTGEPTTGDATSEASTTNTTSTGGELTTGPETGDPPVETVPGCEALCAKEVECDLAMEGDACVEFCSQQYMSRGQACADAAAAFLTCITALSCEELAEHDGFGDPTTCVDSKTAMNDVCGIHDGCSVGWGGGLDECDLEIDCDDEPYRKMACDTETCVCLVNGNEMGSCTAEAICESPEALKEKGWTCCGF